MSTEDQSRLLIESSNSPPLSKTQRRARKQALFQATVLENPFLPDSIKTGMTPKQVEFLCYEGREALYGGAAGGGKSVALLAAALQFVDEPGYSALILRRTYKQLAKADSILSKAKEWLIGRKGVRWNGDEKKFTFPRGTTLEFGHMEHEDSKIDYQGGAWAFVGADEATQFTGSMLAYPRTRQRRPKGSRIPIRWRGGSNPGGIGHEYVKARYVDCAPTVDRQFFPATIEDNPHIDQADYVQQLVESGIDPITLAQLLRGDWNAYHGGRFKREWFRRWGRHPVNGFELLDAGTGLWKFHESFRVIFQTCDPAASAKRRADYTVLSTWGITRDHQLVWLDCERWQLEIPDIPARILASYKRHKPEFVAIEAVAANSAVYQHCRRLPMVVRRVSPLGEDKLVRATGAMNLAHDGRLYLPVASGWLDEAESELVRFTGDEKVDAHDDIVDTLSYAAQVLQGRVEEAGFAPYGGSSR